MLIKAKVDYSLICKARAAAPECPALFDSLALSAH